MRLILSAKIHWVQVEAEDGSYFNEIPYDMANEIFGKIGISYDDGNMDVDLDDDQWQKFLKLLWHES